MRLPRLMPPVDHDEFRTGLREMIPFAFAITVWGLVTGVAMVNAGLSVTGASAMTLTVYAGSAQLATLPLLATRSPLWVVVVTATMVNMRFVIFSAASRKAFTGLPWYQRLSAGYLNGDVPFALFSRRFGDDTEHGTRQQYGYFFATCTLGWVAWQIGSFAGIFLGGAAPTDWGLDLAAYLALVGVLAPMLAKWPAVAGVATTVAIAVPTAGWPMRLGLLAAILAGVAVAIGVETWNSRRAVAQ
ncbi:MAG TPA: AzlC family ABC transporter permease [Ilumatobacteraceae bacterium]|nr:AzlC family ABC transporter permease [Ilumatobacteraceae bacterium]